MPIPIISVAQMREWEKVTWASGQTEEVVIRQAGQAVARKAEELTRPGDRILVLAGKGHNGDDAHVAGEAISGREVKVVRVAEPEPVARGLDGLLGPGPALIIDGLFGIGLSRALSAAWIRLIQGINEARVPILAVDSPSGLNADTGLPLEESIRAAHTLTLGAVKQGMIRSTAWPFVGRLHVAPEIGLVPYPFSTEVSWTMPADFADWPPPRAVAGHKGSHGHLVIVAGSLGYHGAAVLAARGAQRALPGLITLATAEQVYAPVAAQLQSVMVQPWSDTVRLPDSCTALVIGPGLAAAHLPQSMRELTARVWRESPGPVVVDASALEWLPEGKCPQGAIRVITPHPGEAGRLLNKSATEVQSDRPKALRELSHRWGHCCVVLKGHQTLIGCGNEDLFVNCSGNPQLAQGGAGDLLAGYLGGLLAQPALQADPLKTIRYAVWQHGAAADQLQGKSTNWTIEELAEALGSAQPK
jgi:ADP-dependent NAD(P)H-hydrate dehydratase / NAD(P)H-hydrate epimerase